MKKTLIIVLLLSSVLITTLSVGQASYAQSQKTLPSKPTETCIDSDGGKDYYTKGFIDGTFRNREYFPQLKDREDRCEDEITLREFFCQGPYLSINRYNCPGGCSNGACVRNEKKPDLMVKDLALGERREIVNFQTIIQKVITAEVCNIGEFMTVHAFLTELSVNGHTLFYGHGEHRFQPGECGTAYFVATKDGLPSYGSGSIALREGENTVTVTADKATVPPEILPEYRKNWKWDNVIEESNENNNGLTKVIVIKDLAQLEPVVTNPSEEKFKSTIEELQQKIQELKNRILELMEQLRRLKPHQ